ncbi:MAG: ferritin-like domain-containing protein [Candidatus Binatia bacterium]|nr:ferritin-like domain-containing protein [Candidatus Binatia bacterium]
MTLKERLSAGWRWLLGGVVPDDRTRLVEMLCQAYLDEAKDVMQFTAHAERMAYPQFRERLLRIAAEEQTHVQWLREKILALGGTVPEVTVPLRQGKNSWECLRLDVEEEERDYGALLEQMYAVEGVDPELAEGLRRIRAEERRHRAELLDMLLKSEPYAPPVLTPELAQAEREKHEWLEQQKLIWWEQQQAAWEAAGKPVPWAEWKAEREFTWIAHELPNREREWITRRMNQECGGTTVRPIHVQEPAQSPTTVPLAA